MPFLFPINKNVAFQAAHSLATRWHLNISLLNEQAFMTEMP